MKKIHAPSLRAAFRASIPVMAGYVVLGIAFGILLQSKGYSFLWAILMGITIYGGSLQFVSVNLLASGASLISTALISLMVQARHLFYGVSMLTKYKGMGKAKPYLIFSLTDETFALVVQPLPEGVRPKQYYFFVSLLDQCYWVLGSALGGIIGAAITFNTAGIDFAMTALFVTIFTDQWLKTKAHFPALWGLGASLVSLLIFGDDFLIPAMLLIALGLSVYGSRRGWEDTV